MGAKYRNRLCNDLSWPLDETFLFLQRDNIGSTFLTWVVPATTETWASPIPEIVEVCGLSQTEWSACVHCTFCDIWKNPVSPTFIHKMERNADYGNSWTELNDCKRTGRHIRFFSTLQNFATTSPSSNRRRNRIHEQWSKVVLGVALSPFEYFCRYWIGVGQMHLFCCKEIQYKNCLIQLRKRCRAKVRSTDWYFKEGSLEKSCRSFTFLVAIYFNYHFCPVPWPGRVPKRQSDLLKEFRLFKVGMIKLYGNNALNCLSISTHIHRASKGSRDPTLRSRSHPLIHLLR
jgi:hypothetical protein